MLVLINSEVKEGLNILSEQTGKSISRIVEEAVTKELIKQEYLKSTFNPETYLSCRMEKVSICGTISKE